MRLTAILSFTVALLIFASPSQGQIINPTVPTPSNAGASLSRQSVNAGEKVTVTLTLDAPPPRPLTVQAVFSSNSDAVFVQMTFPAGVATATAEMSIPKDADGADYTMSRLQIVSERKGGFLPVPPQTLHVVPTPKAVEVLPSKAVVTLEFDHKQFIRMQAEPLVTLRDDLIGRLNKDAASTPLLTTDLIAALKQADSLLPAVKAKYVSLYKTKPVTVLEPVFFEDFHRNYQAAIIELSVLTATSEPIDGRPHVTTVQQVKRRPTVPGDNWNNHTLAGTYPLAAMAVIELISKNIAAYLLIAESGLDTFSIRLASIPSGASISYKRIGEAYTPLTKSTDVPSATFPYAMWTFKFEKDGCKMVERTPNPYIEERPDLTVELACKVR
jgi:hypothetical protein